MTTQETIELFNKYVIANYKRLPRVIVKGEGCYIYDADGNKILDMFPGWAVSGIGHCHPKVVEAIRKQAGEALLRELRPFVWRRHLDFAAIADIHSIKRQIHTHKAARGAHATIQLEGHDVKLGRGGIREVEFFVQTQQLIFGGRRPQMRGSRTQGHS